MNPNLLISYNPNRRVSAEREIENVFQQIKERPKFLNSTHPGVFKLRVRDPKAVVKKLNRLHQRKPDQFKVTCHYTPLDKWCKSSIKEMQRQVRKYDKVIKNKENWKMDLKKRRHRSRSNAVIMKLTQVINKENVDLTSPKKVIRVELLGKDAGISLLSKGEFLNAAKRTS
tara:strand:- start:1797 stop:2309 length:513 start_codon:yes stop_codon:yes gene_type:complete